MNIYPSVCLLFSFVTIEPIVSVFDQNLQQTKYGPTIVDQIYDTLKLVPLCTMFLLDFLKDCWGYNMGALEVTICRISLSNGPNCHDFFTSQIRLCLMKYSFHLRETFKIGLQASKWNWATSSQKPCIYRSYLSGQVHCIYTEEADNLNKNSQYILL